MEPCSMIVLPHTSQHRSWISSLEEHRPRWWQDSSRHRQHRKMFFLASYTNLQRGPLPACLLFVSLLEVREDGKAGNTLLYPGLHKGQQQVQRHLLASSRVFKLSPAVVVLALMMVLFLQTFGEKDPHARQKQKLERYREESHKG